MWNIASDKRCDKRCEVMNAKWNRTASRIGTLTGMLFFSFLFSLFTFQTGLLAQQRTIALVYDDSGSMNAANGEPCRAVNYALQLMVGLLNPEDRFYVVTMSKADELRQINLQTKQQEIQDIRSWGCRSDTHFLAADTAMRALEDIKDPRSDKWLIIFTDGIWKMSPPAVERIKDFVARSGAKTIILNINAKRNPLCEAFNQIGQADIYQSPANFQSIRQNMESIALSVMSMTKSGVRVRSASDNKVEIDTVFPLKKIILLEQVTAKRGKPVNPTGVSDNTGNTIPVQGTYDALIPGRIQARVSHVAQAGGANNRFQVIPEGKISINFSGTVDVTRFKFLPEVAARLDAKPTGNKIIDVDGNVYSICDKETAVDVQAEIISLDGQRLTPDALRRTKVWVHHDNVKKEMMLNGDVFTVRIPVGKDTVPVSVSAEYPGYFHFRTNVFIVKKVYCKPPDEMGMRTGGYPPVKVTELDKAPYMTLKPLINNVIVTQEEFKELRLDRRDDSKLELEIIAEGTYWKVRPKARWGIPCFTPTGRQEVILELKSNRRGLKSAQGPTSIVFDIQDVFFLWKCWKFIVAVLIFIFLIWYILGLLKKPRFCRGSEIVYQRSTQYMKNKEITFRLAGSFFGRYLVPYRPESAKIQGLKFEAGRRCGYIQLPKEAQTDGMYIAGVPIDPPGRRDGKISLGDEVMVEYSNYKETYTYSRV